MYTKQNASKALNPQTLKNIYIRNNVLYHILEVDIPADLEEC